MQDVLDLISFSAVVTAIVVSVLTTLLVEYLAKPHLEARKERILARVRQREEFRAAVHELTAHVAWVAIGLASRPAGWERWLYEQGDAYVRMVELVDLMHRHIVWALALPDQYQDLAMRYVVYVKYVTLSDHPETQQAKMIHAINTEMGHFVDRFSRWPLWLVPRRRRALKRIELLFDETEVQLGADHPDSQS